ncbi:hypothetical protein BT69DRAFT_1372151 [Atractiella rhizophila]|nr:hypothetical protein BT69DRAFT_1372151 [Atractiella rhizophila]
MAPQNTKVNTIKTLPAGKVECSDCHKVFSFAKGGIKRHRALQHPKPGQREGWKPIKLDGSKDIPDSDGSKSNNKEGNSKDGTCSGVHHQRSHVEVWLARFCEPMRASLETGLPLFSWLNSCSWMPERWWFFVASEPCKNFSSNKTPLPTTQPPPNSTLILLIPTLPDAPPPRLSTGERGATCVSFPAPAAKLDVDVDSTSTWAAAIRDYNHRDYADTNAPLTLKTPKAQRFLDKLLPNPLDHKDPTKVVQLLRDFLNDTRRLKRNEKSMSFKKQEFDFLDSAVDHLSSLLSSPDRIGVEVQKSVSTLKGQVADLKEAVTPLTAAVNPSTLGAKTAEYMSSHLSKLHRKPDAKHLSSIIPHSVSHQSQPQKSQNATNEDVQLTLTWMTPESLDISSPLDELLEEGTVPECNLIKEEPRKIVAALKDIFRTKNIPSEVYEKTPREERIAAKMKPHLRIHAAQRLKSGDLRLHFYYASEVQLAIESQEVWLPPDRIGVEVQKSVSTLKGQVADLKEAVTALTAAVNPSTLGAKTAECMSSHLSKLHGKPDAKHLSSIIPHSVSHQSQPQKSQNATNEDVQLTLTWMTPELLDISSPLDELLEEGTVPECNLIKEEPRKIVAALNDIFRTKNIPSEVYEKTPREERIAAKMKPHLRIRAAQRLKSGDLRLHFYYASEVQLAIESQEVWLPHLESGWSIKHKTYPIIVHAVPSSFDIDNPEEVRSRIEPFNLNLCDHILKMNRCQTKKQAASSQEKAKTHSSLILVVDHSSTADALIEFGLVIDRKAYTVENLVTPPRGARLLSPVEYAPVPILRNLVHFPARIPIHAMKSLEDERGIPL